ncbi:MAG: FAD-dependent monooxygenase [Proteobacteria bacterium]|nr:FAD-dependent monooxygenase [Pseudomonadota bacterium]
MDDTPLIAGAGPTGLAAALFLAERGVTSRIVDPAAEPSKTSKALAVNPRSLELLESTGVTARMLAEGRPLIRARVTEAWKPLAEIDITDVHPRFPMLGLSQARSEALLAEALAERGITPRRGVGLAGLSQTPAGVEVDLSTSDGVIERTVAPLVLGADGAHSAARHALGLELEGSTLPEPWPLYDLELETGLDPHAAQISLYPDGLVFMLALEGGLWRVMGNMPDVLDRLPPGSVAGRIVWESRFKISHRMVRSMAEGRVCLAGDAAHLHSPIGARGMNLGIEDAYAFAACAADALKGNLARLRDYGRLRHHVDHQVVRRVELITRLVRARSPALRMLRRFGLAVAVRAPTLAMQFKRTATGLDHDVALS